MDNRKVIYLDDAIMALKAEMSKGDKEYTTAYISLDGIENVLRSLPSAQPEQRWIPCKEKMPKELTRVLVCTDRGFVCIAYLKVHHKEEDIRWLVYGADPDCRGKVIKWMPLPKT